MAIPRCGAGERLVVRHATLLESAVADNFFWLLVLWDNVFWALNGNCSVDTFFMIVVSLHMVPSLYRPDASYALSLGGVLGTMWVSFFQVIAQIEMIVEKVRKNSLARGYPLL
jgi:hypothetical protein